MTKFLLEKGCPVDAKDSSGNSLVHYATAYGWRSILDLLLAAGAELQVTNDWKISPMFVGMLKGHMRLANVCLNAPGIDVNGESREMFAFLFVLPNVPAVRVWYSFAPLNLFGKFRDDT